VRAAVEACEQCHDDRHTRAYRDSDHFRLWRGQVRAGPSARANTGVSCATCHLPRRSEGQHVTVEHNQNANLRPNEKMVREVCSHCHGLGFSLAALADPALIENNFAQAPAAAAEGIRMALSTRKRAASSARDETKHDGEER
jgi:hypothetical protein